MTSLFHGSRASHRLTRAFALVVMILAVLALAIPASAQILPVTRLAYSAKYICGQTTLNDLGVLPGFSFEYTMIEVHNPNNVAVTVTIKMIQDYPTSGIVVQPYLRTLQANEAMEIDCNTIPPGGVANPFRTGFVEINSPMQIKVVVIHKEAYGSQNLIRSASVAKKSSPAIIILGFVRHSGTFFYGDTPTAGGDKIREETTISIANLSPNPVNAQISIVNSTGPVKTFSKLLNPNGFATVTGADLPAGTPLPFVGGVTVAYPDVGVGVMLECEEIIQKYVVSGFGATSIAMATYEVQPIPVR